MANTESMEITEVTETTDTKNSVMQMIDVHTHFLPGIDDGSRSVEESLKMLIDSKKQGVAACVATPHCILHKVGDIEHFLNVRDEACERLTRAAEIAGCDIPEIYLGSEVYLDNNIIKKFDGVERLCFSGTNYILVELPRQRLDRRVTEWIFNLTIKGLNPILAHVERTSRKELDEIGIWDLDIIFQINAGSFVNFSSRRELKKIFAHNKKFVVGSDMHNTTSRPQCMLKAGEISQKKFSCMTDEIFYTNSKNILRNGAIYGGNKC